MDFPLIPLLLPYGKKFASLLDIAEMHNRSWHRGEGEKLVGIMLIALMLLQVWHFISHSAGFASCQRDSSGNSLRETDQGTLYIFLVGFAVAWRSKTLPNGIIMRVDRWPRCTLTDPNFSARASRVFLMELEQRLFSSCCEHIGSSAPRLRFGDSTRSEGIDTEVREMTVT